MKNSLLGCLSYDWQLVQTSKCTALSLPVSICNGLLCTAMAVVRVACKTGELRCPTEGLDTNIHGSELWSKQNLIPLQRL